MESDLRKMPELAALLQRHHDEIVTEWANQVHEIHDSKYRQYSIYEVREWASQGLDSIIKSLTSGSSQVL